ncbi:hypothetical protein JK361_38195 [Streptomyces sp. 5-8]|uniref:N-acetyltransferase domain-containing protein n=1 Tax=Streptomyces musisoli TaxID=2802280 RepID=A0ABS1PEP2_9ACTN|nr:hypothetical protein [Streptomyces musisoli]MBL1110321.1 hypothetical protein [Streptomyces musisoli]
MSEIDVGHIEHLSGHSDLRCPAQDFAVSSESVGALRIFLTINTARYRNRGLPRRWLCQGVGRAVALAVPWRWPCRAVRFRRRRHGAVRRSPRLEAEAIEDKLDVMTRETQ